MNILIIKNRYKKKLNWKKGISHIEENTPLKLSFEEIDTDFDLSFREVSNSSFTGGVVDINREELKKIVPENKYHAVVLVYSNPSPYVRVSITESKPLYSDTDIIQVVKETDGGKTFNHELFHTFFYRLARRGIKLQDCMDTYKNNNSLDTNDDSNRNDALKLLAPYWNVMESPLPNMITKIMNTITPKNRYLYFKDSEIIGLKPELVELLDKARDIAGIPFKLNSTVRTVAENKKAGGVENSAHLTGEACDIHCIDSASRYKIVTALLKVGFIRIGIADTFVHCDISKTHPQNNIWLYN